MVPADAHRSRVELGELCFGLGVLQLPHGRHLGDGDVVEHTERADHDAGEQEALWVDVAAQRTEVADGLVGEPGQLRRHDEQVGEDGGDREARDRRQQRCRGREVESVGEEKRDEGDDAGGHERHRDGVGTFEQGREQEHHDHDQARRQAGDRAGAAPATEDDDGGHEHDREQQERRRAFEVVEEDLRGPSGLGGDVDQDRVAVTDRAGERLLEIQAVTGELALLGDQFDLATTEERVVAARFDRFGCDVGGDRIPVEAEGVAPAAGLPGPQHDQPDEDGDETHAHGSPHEPPDLLVDVDVEVAVIV